MFEKLSFYDILSYIFPGSIVISTLYIINHQSGFYMFKDLNTDSFFFQCVLFLFAYVCGMVIHNLSDYVLHKNWNKRDNLLWRLKWISRVYKKENTDTRKAIDKYLQDKYISANSKTVQRDAFESMHAQMRKTKAEQLNIMRAQTIMFANSSIAFFIAAFVSAIYLMTICAPFCSYLKYAAPLFLLAVLCYLLAVARQKSMISKVFWNFANHLRYENKTDKQ